MAKILLLILSSIFVSVISGTTIKPAGYDHNPPQPHKLAAQASSSSSSAHHHHHVQSHHQYASPPILPAYTPTPFHSSTPVPPYGVTPTPYPGYGYSPAPGYGPTAVPYGHYPHSPQPSASHHASYEANNYGPPACSKNTTKSWCLMDYEYPAREIQHAIEYHYAAVASLYKDVIANTDNSVDRIKHIHDETYLCPSSTGYVMPLRAMNTNGHWRIVVNEVKAHYETLSQTARVEECTTPGHQCSLIPECYETKCLQKFIYHRFLTYNPYDYYFPFAMETFKLPSSCACFNNGYSHQKH
ncbi:hypothetical protein TCAL_05609 [Tigriopus californicus]|uniref:Spaetzle domain-containing protein n=1 Tax=Tigriopus californicus TaxID=6832 RepID=A0A553NFF3_TIGCA|nr:neurotrophin 1-like isoform X2 [Tigriopus californicus]TRY64183.1 hypothetical protein TCAL_05609 [Tigriopus californicus]|eukprot:TCALIF_05609-PA protein Name:"Protein of unknown function" AED:0.13 eAED:0.14 QI:0/0/0/0.5/1/1/2/0/298